MKAEKKTGKYYTVLTIAGSDSGGGAGVQADIKTISAHGCYALTALTAITAQNTLGVRSIESLSTSMLVDQIVAVLDDVGADAVKIGMLHSCETVRTVADCLRQSRVANVVLDPVMVATSGDRLILDETVETLKNELFPLADLITPNLPEAEILLDRPLPSPQASKEGVRELSKWGTPAVLLKGGHRNADPVVDLLHSVAENLTVSIETPKVFTSNTHGTGCSLSSAIASNLALGRPLEEAVTEGVRYVERGLKLACHRKLGQGSGPMEHFQRIPLLEKSS